MTGGQAPSSGVPTAASRVWIAGCPGCVAKDVKPRRPAVDPLSHEAETGRRTGDRQKVEELKKLVREVPDFPRPGILFYDLTTLLKDREGFRTVVEILTRRYAGESIDQVVGIESRGFILAPPLAYSLGAGFVPVRKKGKLPAETLHASYDLEYGQDILEIHRDAIEPGQRVLVVDDLIATGGTAAATSQMIEELGGLVTGLAFVVELEFLKGREKLGKYDVFSILKY